MSRYCLCVLALLFAVPARAQQAIVTLPSADITPEGKFFVMHETQVRPWDPKPYWNTTHFFTYGLATQVELAATVFNVGVPATGNETLALGFKGNIPLFAEQLPAAELRITSGAMLLKPFDGRGLGHWLYFHVNGRLPLARTRISVGASHGTRQLFERDVLSAMVAIEQPLLSDNSVNLVAEWFSGDHDLANLVVGATYHPDHHWIFVAGYKLSTSEATREKDALVFEVGYFF